MNWPHRVVVTGIGAVTPLGHTAPTYWSRLIAGESGIASPTQVDPDLLQGEVVAEVKDFEPTLHFGERQLPALDRVTQFAVVAAREALAGSGLAITDEMSEQTATIIGTGIGGSNTIDDSYKRLYGEGARRVYPLTVPKLMPNAPASQITMFLGLRGPAFGVVSACSSATHALGLAFQMVRSGIARQAVAGGAESCINVGTLKGWEAMRVMANDTCRPFSVDRRGLVIGEGAGVAVLERLEDARARGADILGEVVGFGMTADAADLTNPDVGGMSRAVTATLADAGIDAGAVDYINAHGTGTAANDKAETAALKAALGERGATVPVSSTKSMVGHALGAAGALEFVATVMAIRDGVAPPNANFLGPDPECDLELILGDAREMPIGRALSNSFAFGGLNAVLAVARAP